MVQATEILAEIFRELGRPREIEAAMERWRAMPGQRNLSITPPKRTALYKVSKGNLAPRSNTLRWLCFWIRHGRHGRDYSERRWGSAQQMERDVMALTFAEFFGRYSIKRGVDAGDELAEDQAAGEVSTLDLVGIGGLNIDYILTRSKATERGDRAREWSSHFDMGSERVVSRERFEAVRREIGAENLHVCFGGSAFNVVQALRCAAPRLRMGYVGAAGEDKKADFERWFDSEGVDRQFVMPAAAKASSCLSYINDIGQRSLLTTKGDANEQLVDRLEEREADLVRYLSGAKVVHITSLFDARAPAFLNKVVRAVKRQSPATRISFDPGSVWCRDLDTEPGFNSLLRQSDLLFLNPEEFELLGGPPMPSEEAAAERILRRCANGACALVYKHRERTSLYYWDGQNRFAIRHYPHEVLDGAEIEDSTGTGDVFAAGVLIAEFVQGLELDEAIGLASEMVRVKLRSPGTRDYGRFGEIVDGTAS